MDNNVGMVAVVQGLQNAQLTVTLMDGGRQYTLMPQTGTNEHASPTRQYHVSPTRQYHAVSTHSTKNQSTAAVNTTLESGLRCDSSIQATDGRYASVYQTSHCHVKPTSPPVQLSEFPPQRAELYPGHGNFEVGGTGSGETRQTPTRIPGCCHGSMSLPDRGTISSPRTSHEPNAFVKSLRKYPVLDRSSEMVEKLINYAQSRNSSKIPTRYISPVRSGVAQETSNQTYLEQNPRNTVTKSKYTDDRPKSIADESPTRDFRTRNEKSDYRSTFNKNAEVRFVKDISRRVAQNMRSLNSNTNSVSNETQASVEMVSREVATTFTAPLKKSVAISLSPCTSNTFLESRNAVSQQRYLTNTMDKNKWANVNFQTIQISSSSTNLLTSAKNCSCAVAKNVRKSASEGKLKEQHVQEIISEIFGNITVKCNDTPNTTVKEEILKNMCLKLQKLSESFDRNDNKDNCVFNLGKKLRDVPEWTPLSYDLKAATELSGDLFCKTKKSKKKPEIFRAALAPQIRIYNNEDNIEDVIKDWVNDVPITSDDFTRRPVRRSQISDALVRKLLSLFSNKSRCYDISTLKRKIINMMTDVPLNTITSKRHHLIVKLVDVLINKIIDDSPHVLKKSNSLEAITNRYNDKTGFVYTTKKLLKPSEEELTLLLFKRLEVFKENFHLNINSKRMNEIIADIIDILLDSTRDLRFDNDNNLKEEIAMYLSKTGLFPSQQTNNLAKHLLEQFKTCVGQTKTKWNNRNFVVLDNTLTRTGPNSSLNETSGIGEITQSNINAILDAYLNELCHQIDEWLTNLPLKIPEVNEKCLRQDVINDLAGDIVDRHRFLELNADHKENDNEELEHLKYQIFKWIKKLVGEEEQETIAHAPNLMKRIRNIPVPMLTNPNQNINNNTEDKSVRSSPKSVPQTLALIPVSKVNVSNQTIQEDSQKSCQGQSCRNNHSTPSQPSVKDLNEEYDEFVKNWVQQLPISVTNCKEQEKAEKARMGIYNGIWKAVTKLKFDPEVFHNQFYYQDMFDNEIEKLLDALPKSDELDAKKHLLKVQLIEKTTNMNELIKSTVERDSFKQQLVDTVANNILRQTVADDVENRTKLNEDLQILNIVENYILNAQYNKEDKVKANVYRKKLLKNLKIFVDELRKSHGKDLKNLDPELFITDVLNALHKVPLPSDETMKEEEDEILLGIEIDQWLSDLPFASNNNHFEQLKRIRLRDALAKKILEIQSNNNISECALDSAVKHEISRFLEKLPIQQNESININFMVDELRNRLKNRANESRKKSVTFQELPNYDNFGRDLLHCSSYIDESGRISFQASPRFCSSYNAKSCPPSTQPSPQFQPNTSGFTEYHPIPNQETSYAPSLIVGGGLANTSAAKPDMSASLGQSYINFEQYRPVSSSLRDSGNYYCNNANQPCSSGGKNQSEPTWLSLEETRNPYYVQPQPLQTQKYQCDIPSSSGNQPEEFLVTLKDSESLQQYEQIQHQNRQQQQLSHRYKSPQRYESPEQYQSIYVDGTNGRSNHTGTRHNQVPVLKSPYNNMNKLENVSSNQANENLALNTSRIAASHAVDQVGNQNKIVQPSTQPGPQFQPNTSGVTEYHSIPNQETSYAPSLIVGGGLTNTSAAKPDMSASLGQSYINFDQYRPRSSSLRDSGQYYCNNANQPCSGGKNQSELISLTLEEARNSYYVQPQPLQTQKFQGPQKYQCEIPSSSGNQPEEFLVTLKDSESLQQYEQIQLQNRQQQQLPYQYKTPQRYESSKQYQSIYVDGTNGRSNHTGTRHNQVSVPKSPYNKLENVSSNQANENLALNTSQIVASHAVDQVGNQSKIVQGNSYYQVPTSPPDPGNICQGINTCRAQQQSPSKSMPRSIDSPIVANEHHGQIPSMPGAITSETIPYQRLRIPQVITNEHGSNETLNNMPKVSTPQAEQSIPYRECAQLQVPTGAVGENADIQYYPSSYDQPQGFSTPYQNHQNTRRESPPRVVKKKGGEDIRTRKKMIRKKLELEDSEVDESDAEECRCLERMWRRRRRYCEDYDMNCPCYMPLPCRYPYFF